MSQWSLLVETVSRVGLLGDDITDYIDTKIEMLSKHKSQIESMNKILKIDLIEVMKINSRYRGQQCNVKYAEAFRGTHTSLMVTTQRILP